MGNKNPSSDAGKGPQLPRKSTSMCKSMSGSVLRSKCCACEAKVAPEAQSVAPAPQFACDELCEMNCVRDELCELSCVRDEFFQLSFV